MIEMICYIILIEKQIFEVETEIIISMPASSIGLAVILMKISAFNMSVIPFIGNVMRPVARHFPVTSLKTDLHIIKYQQNQMKLINCQ